MRTPDGARDHLIWIAAVLAFTLAAATGALYRFGIAYGITGGLDFANVRHAHSHLMYFAWVTPALFLLISRRVASMTGNAVPRLSQISTVLSLILGMASYVPFLVYGYETATFGPVSLPPSVIVAGLNMLAWYGYYAGYRHQTRGCIRTGTLVLFDGALAFLLLSSLGAWSISLTGPLGLTNPIITAAFTHIFLGFFSEGWLLLAVLGLAMTTAETRQSEQRLFLWATWVLVAGITATFLLGMPQSMVSSTARTIARLASLFMAAGLAVFAVHIFRRSNRIWRLPGFFLGLKSIGFIMVLFTPTIWWADFVAERILYFHIHLLGFVTLGILAAARQSVASKAPRQVKWMNIAVVFVILSLVPMTMFWPSALRGVWTLKVMAWSALGPAIVGFWMILFQRPEPMAHRPEPMTHQPEPMD